MITFIQPYNLMRTRRICSLPLTKNIKRVVQGFMYGGRLAYCMVLLWKFVNLLARLPGKMRTNEFFPYILFQKKERALKRYCPPLLPIDSTEESEGAE